MGGESNTTISNRMVASLAVSLVLWFGAGLDPDDPGQWAGIMIVTVACSTAAWLAVMFLTRPETDEVLDGFYRRVRPGGPGWSAVSRRLGFGREEIEGGALNWTNWVAGVVAVYTALFGTGKLIFGAWGEAAALLALTAVSFAWIARNLRALPPDRGSGE